MGVGFIRDKLEIKFLILYIAARVSEPLPLEGMQELTMCDDGIDYFDFSECLNDLVQTEHLRLTEEGRYAITPKGLKNSAICESSLPYSVRLRTDRNIEEYNKELLRQAQVQGKALFINIGEMFLCFFRIFMRYIQVYMVFTTLFLSSSTRRNSCPTAPLAPTIATFIFLLFFMLKMEY